MTDVAVPSHVPPELVRTFDFNFHGPLEDLFPRIDALRDEGERVLWLNGGLVGGGYSEGPRGAWLFCDSDDIRQGFQTTDLFSSANMGGGGIPMMIPISMDPPEHTKYRRLLTPLFAPAVVQTMEDSIRARIVKLVDDIAPNGETEFVSEVAIQFPTRVFTSWIGLPEEETVRFVNLSDVLIHGTDDNERAEASLGAVGVLMELITARMAHPTDDLMSQIVVQEVDGRPLTEDELLSIAFLLFLAGLDTVAAALSFSFWHLAQTPADRAALVNHEIPAAQAVEELLRRHSFVNLGRTVTRDAEFAGVQLKQGDTVMLSTVLASRDPDEYDAATEVQLDRESPRHYAFGAGPHRCVGSHLARLEMRIAFDEWHARIPDYRLGGPVESYGGGVMGVTTLPLTWK